MNGGRVQIVLSKEHQKTFDKLAGVAMQHLGIDGVINLAIEAMTPMAAMGEPEIVALVAHIKEQVVQQNDGQPAPTENRKSRRAASKKQAPAAPARPARVATKARPKA